MQRLGAFRVGIILRRLTPIEHAVIASSDAFSMGLRNQVAASYFIGHLGNGPMPQPPQGQGKSASGGSGEAPQMFTDGTTYMLSGLPISPSTSYTSMATTSGVALSKTARCS